MLIIIGFVLGVIIGYILGSSATRSSLEDFYGDLMSKLEYQLSLELKVKSDIINSINEHFDLLPKNVILNCKTQQQYMKVMELNEMKK